MNLKRIKLLIGTGLIFLLFYSCIPENKPADSGLQVVKINCRYVSHPLGIDETHPSFTWELQSETRNQVQTAYQILVASSKAQLDRQIADAWNSGKVMSDRSVQIRYEGMPLKSSTRYYWKVRVWDGNGHCSNYSDVAWFETGLLLESDWKAKWIGAPLVFDWRKRSRDLRRLGKDAPPVYDYSAPLFRKSFIVDKTVISARAYISGVGFYEMYVNGEKVGDRLLDPAFTDYDKTVLYSTLDLTPMIKKGENAVGIMLGNGWYNMPTRAAWGFDLAPWRADPALKCQIEIAYKDGTREMIVTNKDWKCAPGPVTFNSIRQGETFDANKIIPGWNEPGLEDGTWIPAHLVRGPAGKLMAQTAPPVEVIREFEPVRVMKLKNGHYMLDFGQNMSGFIQIKVNGDRGDSIVIKYGERLFPDGRVDQRLIAEHTFEPRFQTDIFILSGKGEEVFQPHFVYHGFRYAEISGLRKMPSDGEIVAKAITSSFENAGAFISSNELLNRIQHNTLWSYTNNFVGYPTDCPQREKNGWTGDAQLACETGLFNFMSQPGYVKWVHDLTDAMKPDGMLPGIVPTSGWGYHWGNGPAWDHAIMNIPWNLYVYSGDREILESTYPFMKKYVDFLGTRAQNHIVRWGLGDWAPARTKTPEAVTSTAYYYEDARLLAETAKVLGKDEDAEKYAALAGEIKTAFNREFYNRKKGIYSVGSQTALSCPLYFGLVDSAEVGKVLGNLEQVIDTTSINLDFGILGAKYVLNTFTMYEHPAPAYRIVDTEAYPGWGYWVKKRTTTLWEQWNDNSGSLNHIMYGDVSAWMYKTLAGIRPDPEHPGFKHFFVHPWFPEDLQWVKAHHNTPYGRIEVQWKRMEGSIRLEVSVPVNTSATVTFPVSNLKQVMEAGKPMTKRTLLDFNKGKGQIQLTVGSGNYEFEILL